MKASDISLSTSQISGSNGDRLSKVPAVTIYFWVIKVLCTTVGETASDFLNVNLGLGLTGTSIFMGILLLIALFFQFKAEKYIPAIYWLAVVFISIFGTLITDYLTDKMHVSLEFSTIFFTATLALTFLIWYAKEKTLSIHSIFTKQRESFYWLAILFTFALGTAAGDLMAESLGLGYLVTGLIVCIAIIIIATAWYLGLDAVLGFWMAYILTRPLGASLGDYLSQSKNIGGLGFGATMTSAIFLLAIFAVVIFLMVSKRDLFSAVSTKILIKKNLSDVFLQVIVVVLATIAIGGYGYHWRHTQLKNQALASTSYRSPLGDLSNFRKIAKDTFSLVHAGNLPAAKTRVTDLESAWDNAEAHIKPMNPEQWYVVDESIDNVLRKLRAVTQDPKACSNALDKLIKLLNSLDGRK